MRVSAPSRPLPLLIPGGAVPPRGGPGGLTARAGGGAGRPEVLGVRVAGACVSAASPRPAGPEPPAPWPQVSQLTANFHP